MQAVHVPYLLYFIQYGVERVQIGEPLYDKFDNTYGAVQIKHWVEFKEGVWQFGGFY